MGHENRQHSLSLSRLHSYLFQIYYRHFDMTVLFSFTIHRKISVKWKGNKEENVFLYEPRARWEVYANFIHRSTVYRICTRQIHENFIDRKVTTQRIFVFMLWLWGYCWPRWCGRKWILNEKEENMLSSCSPKFVLNVPECIRNFIKILFCVAEHLLKCTRECPSLQLTAAGYSTLWNSSWTHVEKTQQSKNIFKFTVAFPLLSFATVALLPSKKELVFYLDFRFQQGAVHIWLQNAPMSDLYKLNFITRRRLPPTAKNMHPSHISYL